MKKREAGSKILFDITKKSAMVEQNVFLDLGHYYMQTYEI